MKTLQTIATPIQPDEVTHYKLAAIARKLGVSEQFALKILIQKTFNEQIGDESPFEAECDLLSCAH